MKNKRINLNQKSEQPKKLFKMKYYQLIQPLRTGIKES